FVIHEIWPFLIQNFSVRPEREAHILAGGSMGGYAAYHLAFKHRHTFGVIVGIMPPLDIRYVDCHDNYMGPYDPHCSSYRETMRPNRIIGRFYSILVVREKKLTDHTVGKRNPEGMQFYSRENPVEMLDALGIQPHEFAMYLGIAGKDEFNLDAQAEHFLDVAHRRGICVDVVRMPNDKHNISAGMKFIPTALNFLQRHVQPYAPADYRPNRLGEPLLLESPPSLRLFVRPLSSRAGDPTTLWGR
ncbi:MAG: alpha/beta hydrolase-fold protein, partial [Gemmataceae bacterium]